MTGLEARERADKIWGEWQVNTIRLRPDGGADVELERAPTLRLGSYHQLDANGHATCHMQCITREQELA